MSIERYEIAEMLLQWMREHHRCVFIAGADRQIDTAVEDLADAGKVAVERLGEQVIVTLLPPRKE